MNANSGFLLGTAEADITPPHGLPMAGSLNPQDRLCVGTAYPLQVKAMVVAMAGERLAFASFDLIALDEENVREALSRIESETGIPSSHVLWTCSHTHSGPVTPRKPSDMPLVDTAWVAKAMDTFADCVKRADAAKKPASPFLSRGFVRNVMANRRDRFKGGVQTNNWLPPPEIQCLGSAAPVDPEVGVLGFETDGPPALLYNFACHANSAWGLKWHPDYPATTAEQLKDAFAMFTPGACGDVNPTADVETFGKTLGAIIKDAVENRRQGLFPPELGATRKFVELPLRVFDASTEARLQAWPDPYFRKSFDDFKALGKTQETTSLQVAHVGDVAFATAPGELFVEHGLRIKRESPFPWTFPIELSGDSLGYLITQDAWNGGGYESIPSSSNRISPQGVDQMVDELIDMLHLLRRKQIFGRLFPREVEIKGGGERVIRPLRGADAEALADFPAEDYFQPSAREDALANAAKAESNPYYACLILEAPDKAIDGYAWYGWGRGAEKSGFGICLRRDHQRLGVGRKLMAALLEAAKLFGPPTMRLEVQPANAEALELHSALGFKKVGEIRRQGHGGLNYQMELRLAEFHP